MEWSGVQCSGVCRIGRLYFCNFETVFVEREKGKGKGSGKVEVEVEEVRVTLEYVVYRSIWRILDLLLKMRRGCI